MMDYLDNRGKNKLDLGCSVNDARISSGREQAYYEHYRSQGVWLKARYRHGGTRLKQVRR